MKNFPHPNLLTTKEVCELIGVSKATLNQWRRLGLIAPVLYQGRFPFWEKLPQYRIEALHRDSARRKLEGARKGNRVSAQNGTLLRGIDAAHKKIAQDPEILRKGRIKRATEQEAQAPEGALDKKALLAQTGLPIATLDRWIRYGWVIPLHRDPKWRKSWFEPLTPEQVQALRKKAHDRLVEVGRRNMAGVLERWHGGDGKAHREANRPSPDHLMVEEVAELVGEKASLVASATKDSILPSVKVGRYKWILHADVEPWNQERLAKKVRPVKEPLKGKEPRESQNTDPKLPGDYLPSPKPGAHPKSAMNPRTKATSPKPVVLPRFSPSPSPALLSEAQKQPRNFSAYDEAVEAGKANPAFQGPLGFNLLLHSTTGAYRAAPVSIVPQDGWNYHQRHHRNGLGQWQIRTMSRYGEVHL